MAPDRVRELVATMNAAPGADSDDPSYVGFAYSQAVGEGVLVAVAHYIATHEMPSAAAS